MTEKSLIKTLCDNILDSNIESVKDIIAKGIDLNEKKEKIFRRLLIIWNL